MDNRTYEHESNVSQFGSFLTGMVLGGLSGATAMLLLAPQSGKKTRANIQKKSTELRKRAIHTVEDSLKQVRTKAHQISDDVQEQAGDLQQRGQDMIDQQRDNLGTSLKDLAKAVQT
ncbi:MAG: YtxH domain-containing protein [Anaerolineae bacterium]|nr:YtxH domain-containing protein [Anaerolineae bacterium]